MSLPLCVILGPTASGKSALAHAVARSAGAQILSVDSMTVYRGMDVGTAKPSAEERAHVSYHGLDLAEPNETFTVARWMEMAERVIHSRSDEATKRRSDEGDQAESSRSERAPARRWCQRKASARKTCILLPSSLRRCVAPSLPPPSPATPAIASVRFRGSMPRTVGTSW